MLNNKYKAFLKDLKYEFYVPIEYNTINEDVAVELGKLRKGNITKNYTIDKWNNLLSAKYNNFPEIICGIFKAENVPDEIYNKIINDITLSDKQCASIACCDKLTDKQADTLKSKRPPSFWKSLIYDSRIKLSEELYKSLADCIFEIMPQTPLEKQRHNNALKQVRNMMLQGSLTECCQLDFVSRFQNQTFDIDKETYKTILQCSKSSYVINLACQYKMREYKEDIMQNKNLTEDVMENLMNFFTIEKGKEIFLKIYNNKKTSEETTMKYLCHNDININRTIALHSEMPDKVYETLMRKNEYSDEFTALCNIGDALLDVNDEMKLHTQIK